MLGSRGCAHQGSARRRRTGPGAAAAAAAAGVGHEDLGAHARWRPPLGRVQAKAGCRQYAASLQGLAQARQGLAARGPLLDADQRHHDYGRRGRLREACEGHGHFGRRLGARRGGQYDQMLLGSRFPRLRAPNLPVRDRLGEALLQHFPCQRVRLGEAMNSRPQCLRRRG